MQDLTLLNKFVDPIAAVAAGEANQSCLDLFVQNKLCRQVKRSKLACSADGLSGYHGGWFFFVPNLKLLRGLLGSAGCPVHSEGRVQRLTGELICFVRRRQLMEFLGPEGHRG